ncbi:MAG: vitamin B12 dependent-methionine synthase activation domain-containing protein, partial [Acetanaerobacterium sp.]
MKLLLQNRDFSPQVDMKEAVRYLGYRKITPDDDMMRAIELAAHEAQETAIPRFVCAQFALSREGGVLSLADTQLVLEGKAITRHLRNAQHCILFAATLGTAVDMLSRRYQSVSPTRALLVDACANTLIEDLCDRVQAAAEAEVCGAKERLTWRFSPGYGDLPLTVHRKFLPLLDTQRRIGLTETEQHLLTPQKSVTAIMGIVPRTQEQTSGGCAVCEGRDNCSY